MTKNLHSYIDICIIPPITDKGKLCAFPLIDTKIPKQINSIPSDKPFLAVKNILPVKTNNICKLGTICSHISASPAQLSPNNPAQYKIIDMKNIFLKAIP